MFWLFIPLWVLIGILLGGLVGRLIEAIVKKPRQVSNEYRNRLVLSFYGAASSGKTSGVKALFGVDSGSIHPIPGTTKKVSVWTLPDGLSVADTPGLQDTDEKLVERAKGFIDNVDIFIYIINSNGGITKKVKADILLLRAVGRPLAVALNKIDLIRPHQKEEFTKHQYRVAGVPSDTFFVVAFDPLLQDSNEPINIESLRNWIIRTINNKGDELLKEKQNAMLI